MITPTIAKTMIICITSGVFLYHINKKWNSHKVNVIKSKDIDGDYIWQLKDNYSRLYGRNSR